MSFKHVEWHWSLNIYWCGWECVTIPVCFQFMQRLHEHWAISFLVTFMYVVISTECFLWDSVMSVWRCDSKEVYSRCWGSGKRWYNKAGHLTHTSLTYLHRSARQFDPKIADGSTLKSMGYPLSSWYMFKYLRKSLVLWKWNIHHHKHKILDSLMLFTCSTVHFSDVHFIFWHRFLDLLSNFTTWAFSTTRQQHNG